MGLKGVADDDVDKVAALVQGTFEKIAEEGFPRERVDAVMHQVRRLLGSPPACGLGE